MGGEVREIAFCGIVCTECPARQATAADDSALRAKTAEEWSKAFNASLNPEDIRCEGCTSAGAKFAHCLECNVRLCGVGRGVQNCGTCGEYGICSTIKELHAMVPQAKGDPGRCPGGFACVKGQASPS